FRVLQRREFVEQGSNDGWKQPKDQEVEDDPQTPGPPNPICAGVGHDPQYAGDQRSAQYEGDKQGFARILDEQAGFDTVKAVTSFQLELAPGREGQAYYTH